MKVYGRVKQICEGCRVIRTREGRVLLSHRGKGQCYRQEASKP